MHLELEQSVELFLQGSLGASTYMSVDQLRVFEHKHRRDTHDAELSRHLFVLVHIELTYTDLSIEQLCHLINDRRHHAARTAPWCPEIYYQRFS